jgi:hemolysin D
MKQLFSGNGKNGNGANATANDQTNDNGQGTQGNVPIFGQTSEAAHAPTTSAAKIKSEAFDQPVILKQTSLFSRAIVWGIVGVTAFVVLWASFARLEEAVPATGKLEPKESVQPIQAPVGGVVQEVLVRDGDRVQKGQVLIRFDPRASKAQRQSLEQIRNSLVQENAFYRSLFAGNAATSAPINLRPEVQALAMNRVALASENQTYQAILNGSSGENLRPDQRARVMAGRVEANSRASAAQLEVAQLQEQLNQVEVQLRVAQQTLAIDQRILNDVGPLVEEGGLARVQYLRQQQEAMKGRAEVQRLMQEKQRLQFAIAQSQQKLQNTLAVTANDLLTKMGENSKRVAEIDSQFNKAIVENEKRIAEIDSQLSQAKLQLDYQELRAPIDGVVFDLQAKGTGFVANTSEPILKIVPSNNLVAEVYITNQDIGFVQEGMHVDVRIDSFPFSEFGDIKGTVTRIGSDALPPDQINPYYRFPARVELDRQTLNTNGREIPLQSGMSISTNIITRDRTVMSIFTDLFSRRVESLKNVR